MAGGGDVGHRAVVEGRIEGQAAERQLAEPAERQRQAGDIAGVLGIAVTVRVSREVVGRYASREVISGHQAPQPVGHASGQRVVREAGEPQCEEVTQRARDRPAQAVVPQGQFLQGAEVAQLGRNRPAQLIVVQVQRIQGAEVAQGVEARAESRRSTRWR